MPKAGSKRVGSQAGELRRGSGHTKPLNIFLLGDPAAGKATQAAWLTRRFHLYDLDMGRELRFLKARDPRVRKLLERTYDKGKTTQTNLVRGIFKKRISDVPKRQGILFDGNPKMIGEAKLIYRWLTEQGRNRAVLVYLSIPMSETVARTAGRREYFKGKYSKRSDDTPGALKNRVKYYRTQITHVVSFFKSKYPYRKISGLGTRAEVRQRILKFLKPHLDSERNN